MVLSATLGAIGSLGSSAISALASSGSAYRSYKYSKKLQQHQFNLNQKSLLENPNLSRQGYESAGFNPLLALGSQGMGFSASASQSPTNSGFENLDLVDSATSAMTAIQNLKNLKANVKKTKEETKGVELDNTHKELENQKLQNDINTSPKTIISELITNGESKTGNSAISRLRDLKNSYGFEWLQPRNFIKTNVSRFKNVANHFKPNYSAKSSYYNGRPFELNATKNFYTDRGFSFEYRPDLDKKGELPYSLAKYKK